MCLGLRLSWDSVLTCNINFKTSVQYLLARQEKSIRFGFSLKTMGGKESGLRFINFLIAVHTAFTSIFLQRGVSDHKEIMVVSSLLSALV
jgi:hypothetical protein